MRKRLCALLFGVFGFAGCAMHGNPDNYKDHIGQDEHNGLNMIYGIEKEPEHNYDVDMSFQLGSELQTYPIIKVNLAEF